jgi:hypothetical protein
MTIALIVLTGLVFLGIILITTTGRVSTLGSVLVDNVPQVRLRTAILRQRLEKAFVVLAIASALVILIGTPLIEWCLHSAGYGLLYVGPLASAVLVLSLIILLILQMVRPLVPKLAKVPRPPRPKWKKALVISGAVLAGLTVFAAFLFSAGMFFLFFVLAPYILGAG